MSEQQAAEKTEKPTQHRRDKARKEGQVALSQEVGVALAVFSLVMSLSFIVPAMSEIYLKHVQGLMAPSIDGVLDIERTTDAMSDLAWGLCLLAGPVAIFALLVGTAGSALQVGIHVNWENLGPKWNRLNPQNWFGRVFSVELPVSLAKSGFKGIGVVLVAILGVYDLPGRLWRLAGLSAVNLAIEMQAVALAVTIRVMVALLLLALFDIFWTRYRFEQKLMMSRQEVKDELKDTEGNPLIKSAQRKRMTDSAQKRLKQAVSEATVVTTNPTHYAIALRYWRGKDASPVVVAKGIDFKAQRIKVLAKELGIPVVEDKPLARALYSLVREGQNVPVDLYRSVARLLAVVYRRRGYLNQRMMHER